jgi:hypothetical protein
LVLALTRNFSDLACKGKEHQVWWEEEGQEDEDEQEEACRAWCDCRLPCVGWLFSACSEQCLPQYCTTPQSTFVEYPVPSPERIRKEEEERKLAEERERQERYDYRRDNFTHH